MPCLAGDVAAPRIQYDFHGFPEALYRIQWPLKGEPDTARWLTASLQALLPELERLPDRPFDHGVWVPLIPGWPAPAWPVYQLSLCPERGARWHLELGRRMTQLRDEGVLIVGSGGLVHNLSRIDWQARCGIAAPWADAFMQAVTQALKQQEVDALCNPWQLPHGRDCVPTTEHYLPLLVVLGAANGDPVYPLHEDWEFGSLAMHSYAVG